MKSIIVLLPATIAALSAPLSRRNAITGSLAAAAVPGASNAAPSAAVIGYDDVVLDLPCGARVPACVWLPSDGIDAPPASYKYRISAGRLVKTILGLPTPDAIARTFALDAPGVREAPGATVKDGTPVVVVAHGDDLADQPARGDDAVTLLEAADLFLVFLLPLHLRADDQEPEDEDHAHEGQELDPGRGR